jgi:hypothetical protein
MSNEMKLSERFAEALRESDMVRMDNETNTAIISLRIGPGEMDEVLAVLRAAEAKEDALATAAEALEAAKTCINMTYGLQFKTFRQEHAKEIAIVDQIEKALAAINAAMEGKT